MNKQEIFEATDKPQASEDSGPNLTARTYLAKILIVFSKIRLT